MTSSSLCIKMELSPVSGGRSSSSDFSIERILSDEPRGHREESPSWLCCTRYRPPRLQRAPAAGSRTRRSGRHARVPFTAAQAAALEAAYSRAPYLAPPALRALASALQLRDDRIKIWFQNRRARERREKCSTITPPHEITLPATVPLPPTHLWLQDNGDSSRLMNEDRNRSMYEGVSESRMEDCYSEDNEESNESNVERSQTPLDVESID